MKHYYACKGYVMARCSERRPIENPLFIHFSSCPFIDLLSYSSLCGTGCTQINADNISSTVDDSNSFNCSSQNE